MQIRKINKFELTELFDISKSAFDGESWTYSQFESAFCDENYIFLGAYDLDLCSFVVANESIDDVNILSIATKQNKMRCGYAKALIEYLTNYAKDNKKTLSLEVKENNQKAISLYKKMGFYEVCKRKNYYRDGQTAIVMFSSVAKNDSGA